MKLTISTLAHLKEQSDVVPGNIYPAKGGRKGTDYWLVVAITSTGTGAVCIGFDSEGSPCSTATYLKGAMRERPVIGHIDLSKLVLETRNDNTSRSSTLPS